jgi:hypothetical protein
MDFSMSRIASNLNRELGRSGLMFRLSAPEDN